MEIRLVFGIDQPSLSASDAYKRSSPVVTLHPSPSSISYCFHPSASKTFRTIFSPPKPIKIISIRDIHIFSFGYPKMLFNTPKSLLLLDECDSITDSEGSQNPRTRLLLSTPLEPSVLRTATVKSIIQRNPYRHAKVELGLYLLLDSDPMLDGDLPSAGHQSSSSTGNYWLDCAESETSISFHDPNEIPSHLYNPPRLPMMQLLKNWWRYR
ncbi:hypothetical protein PTTG_25929 [Puccinia triticina 1-1 BBBD Race 1]|uniref:Uncharacterized protein n=2 Tax=Puccinia triticina TaxID=208348 RepID=A0A180GYU1_PUCT1|nr:hypothetical protein PTTG_25929 [Puccinia triticina 1-1 BBBD Race 1]